VTTVEVLAPVRLETRFAAGPSGWTLRLRVYPDEFSIRMAVTPPTPDELDRLTEAATSMTAPAPLSARDAFADFAAAVGAQRALLLWRTCLRPDGSVDRAGQQPAQQLQVHLPAGLPSKLDVWFVHTSGLRENKHTLTLDLTGIADDLDLTTFGAAIGVLDAGKLPVRWWNSYARAIAVGLGADIPLGSTPPDLDALVVCGTGDTDAADLVDAHNQTGRLAVLAPGQPTNTISGEPTVDFGADAATLFPLAALDPAQQPATRSAVEALTGRIPPGALPMLGGDRDGFAPGSLAVQGLWPVLWGRSLRDAIGAGAREIDLARWARHHLAVEGPRPTIRVADQPYGLLPTSAFAAWTADPADPDADLEDHIRSWALPWRAGAAAAARAAAQRVLGADTDQLIDVFGRHAPHRYWRARPIADRTLVQAIRLLSGLPPLPDNAYDRDTAIALRDIPAPAHPIAPAAHARGIPGPPHDEHDTAEQLMQLVTMHPEPLYYRNDLTLGLVGHLFREALICAHAIVGEALDHRPAVVDQPLPLDDEPRYARYVMSGGDAGRAALEARGDPAAAALAARHRDVIEALTVFADLWGQGWQPQLFRATLAALDTAAYRVDPWLTGLAERRLQTMIESGAPFKVGAYGWVDAPAPYTGPAGARLAPGPTAAGLLHAPSHIQALTAALLRDAAVRHPDDPRWNLTVDSAKVRAAIALAERVRLGVHPYEALGLEVERIAGDWDVVRTLRSSFPLGSDTQQRRTCDGAAVLRAAREATLPAGLPADLPTRLQPLDDVLDTYADLLVADGVHALVTGRADLANAAMEAAAGLGAPPELRAIRTARSASTVRVACWIVLPASAGLGDDPVTVADPTYASLAVGEAGDRLAALLGGGDPDAPVPSLTGGTYPGLGPNPDTALRQAVVADLDQRLTTLRTMAGTVRAGLAGRNLPSLLALAASWHIHLTDDADIQAVRSGVDAALNDRLTAAKPVTGDTDAAVNARRTAVRTLCGKADVPVMPVVPRGLLPSWQPDAGLDRTWLEIVAAVRPRLAALEARQLEPAHAWPAALAAPTADPWQDGPILVAYGPGIDGHAKVALTALDAWTDAIPSRSHTTSAAFGFNSPKSRAPQAVLLAVPPDPSRRISADGLLDVILETRELAHARGAGPADHLGLPYTTPQPLVHASAPARFLKGWPT